MTTGIEYVGDMKFAPASVTQRSSLADWLQRARQEYAMSRIAAVLLNMDDAALEQHVHSLGETDEERANAAADLAEWFEAWVESYRAGEKVTTAALCRVVVIGERLCGREAVEGEARS